MAAFVPHRSNKYFHVTASNGIVFELALYTARDHDCISNRIGSSMIRDADVVSLRSVRSQRRR
jgi:hypothetical protein